MATRSRELRLVRDAGDELTRRMRLRITDDGGAATVRLHDRALGKPSAHEPRHLAHIRDARLVAAACALGPGQGRQEWQRPNARTPRHANESHHRDPSQAEALRLVTEARVGRVAPGAGGADAAAATPLDRVVGAEDDRVRREGGQDEAEQELCGGAGAPDGAVQDALWVCKPFNGDRASVGNGSMVALWAKSWRAVNDFHSAALAHGGVSEGAPGLRLLYNPDFYAAYVRDPDGNKLAIVCRGFTSLQGQ